MRRPGISMLLLFAGSMLAIGAALLDASSRRARAREVEDQRFEVAHALGISGLALSSHARWLRNPVLSEPRAACMDSPFSFDTDPAGGLIGPPSRARFEPSLELRRR